MKIPETSANVGAYYGNEENGQWQPNGVIIDTGVGGGVVGSGDAGIHRPPVYPVHIPRGHIPGYVMAGAFYPPGPYPVQAPAAAPQDDFEDYMWMENEEEFDKQVMQQLEEEALMEQCIEAMLEDEQRERHRPVPNGHNKHYPTTSSNGSPLSLEETVSRSTLNPLAAEFVPTSCRMATAPPPEESADPPEVALPGPEPAPVAVAAASVEEQPAAEPSPPEDAQPTPEPPQPEEPTQPAVGETPVVSAADVLPQDKDKRPKDKKDTKKRDEPKKAPVKQEPAKPKAKPAAAAKSEPRVPKKREVKADARPAKSEGKLPDEAEAPKTLPPPPVVEEPVSVGVKPINYAAAAKANKPKAKPTTPPTEKTPPPPPKADRVDKKPEKTDKPAPKTEKTVPRKNSMK